jgi:hypothetical protein
MTTYNTYSKQLISNYACIATLEPTEIVVGQSITVAALGSPFNGTVTVLDLPQFAFTGIDSTTGEWIFDNNVPRANQIIYTCVGTNVEYVVALAGTVAYTQTCSWITAAQILTWLGIATATADDTTFVTQCASAANVFCYRRRQECGYFDSLTTSPSGDVTLATIMYGGALYRQRGGISDFASFDGMSAGSTNGLSPIVKQLLGIDRPQVA